MRDYLDERGFLEIETPVLSNPTPEGARDFLVPSRLNPARFTRCPRRRSSTSSSCKLPVSRKYFQIARASATKTCAPIASRSSRSSTSKRRSSTTWRSRR
jgi:aspartyl-tRNA synthetase